MNQIFGYHFKNPALLKQALTHPSLCLRNSNNLQSYERLEFLGDSVLSLVMAELLMNKFPEEDEGKLAKRRASVVCGEILSKIAIDVNLGEQLLMSVAEERSGGRSNVHNLENSLEAIIGAIYLDGGIESLREVVNILWKDFLDNMLEVPTDPKSKLQEILQKSGHPIPKYELISSEGPKHDLVFKISLKIPGFEEIIGQGKSKQQAEKEAAALLLKNMGE